MVERALGAAIHEHEGQILQEGRAVSRRGLILRDSRRFPVILGYCDSREEWVNALNVSQRPGYRRVWRGVKIGESFESYSIIFRLLIRFVW